MNKYKKITLFFLLFSLFNTKVYASCTTEEKNAFKKISDKFTATYQYDTESNSRAILIKGFDTKDYSFTIDIGQESECKLTNNNDIICTNVETGKYTLEVVGNTDTCNDVLKTIAITVSDYNPYYNDPLCEGIEEFVLCQRTYDKEIDRATFESRVATYKKSKSSSSSPSTENNNPNNVDKILEYIKDNLTQIIIILVFTILIIITIILTAKNAKERRRLE